MDPEHSSYQRVKHWTLWRLREYAKLQPNGCMEWQRTKSAKGYGILSITEDRGRSRREYCHRALWEFTHEIELSGKSYVRHRCGNPSCVNIEHLFVPSPEDSDQIASKPSGAHTGSCFAQNASPRTRIRRFSSKQIVAMREDKGLLREVAARHGTTASYISKLRAGKAKTLLRVTAPVIEDISPPDQAPAPNHIPTGGIGRG